MGTLHLGVIDLAYSDADTAGGQTTFQVAEILEEKYQVMKVFVQQHEDEIVKAVTDRYRNVLNRVLEGNSRALNEREWPMPKIVSAFRDYLSNDEWQKVTGRSIAAAKAGISHRFKDPTGRAVRVGSIASGKATKYTIGAARQGEPRPAFIDTGLYQRSFQAWLTP